MAPFHYSDDSDSDLPELDELINKHVKGLHALNAPKLSAPKIAAARLPSQKSTAKATKARSDSAKSSVPTKTLPTLKTPGRQQLELKSAPKLEKPETKSRLQQKARAPSAQENTERKGESLRTRATPYRRAKPASYRIPRIEDSESDESRDESAEHDVEESIWCDSDKEDKPRTLFKESPKKPSRKLGHGHTTPDTELSHSEEDVFLTPPSKPSEKASKECAQPKASDDLAQKLLQLGLDDSDKENDNLAILRFSPPRTSKPVVLERPATPPPASPSKSRLVSPSKTKQRIPTPPHAPHFEDFWNVHAVNNWNDQHSPQKPLMSPKKNKKMLQEDSDSPSSSPKKTQSPTKKSRAALDAKKDFENRKHKLVEDFFQELDSKITEGKIKELATSTGGVKFIWSRTLNSTAGRANWKRETNKTRNLDGTTTVTQRNYASIELAEKVIDDEERLLNVVAHEFCHLANFMVSGIKDQPHGQQFKVWGRKCSEAFAHRGVEVTTKHSYHIDYKYIWTCTNELCAQEFKRHSKSIDPMRHSCGACKSKLAQTKPVPRKQAGTTGYAAFVKANFAGLKQEMAGSSHKEVMTALGQRYREQKAKGEVAGVGAGAVDDVAKAFEVVTLDSD